MVNRKIKFSIAAFVCTAFFTINNNLNANTKNSDEAKENVLSQQLDAEQLENTSEVSKTLNKSADERVKELIKNGIINPATDKKESGTININVSKSALRYVSGVVYSQVSRRGYENVPLTMDIIRPQTNVRDKNEFFPTVIFVTGGGFINANKDGYLQQRVQLAEAGYTVASIEYRVAPTTIMPQPLEDVKAAIRFLRANAEKYNVDVDNIGLWGGSAGGYLVSIAGTTNGMKDFDKGENLGYSSDIQAVVNSYGLSDLTKIGADYSPENQELHKSAGATEALWVNGSPVFGGKDGGILADLEKAKAANPITYISKKTPPFLLLHGDKDVVVSPSQTGILHEALVENGIDSTRYIVKGAAHGGVYWTQPEIMDLIIQFFDKNLKK